MKATKSDTRQTLRPRKTRATTLVMLWALAAIFLCPAPRATLAQRPGTMSVNLNDAGAQMGRLMNGVTAPPAAFAGGERPDTASFQMSVPLVNLPGRGLDIDLGLHYDSSLYQLTWNGRNAIVDSTVKHPYYPGYGFSLGFGMLVHHAAIQDCRNYSLGGSCATQSCNTSPFGGPTLTHSRAFTYFDQTGARHRLERGISVDSSDLRLRTEDNFPTVTFPDGTKVRFASFRDVLIEVVPANTWRICNNQVTCAQDCSVYDRVYYPTKVTDRNGNFIQINYLNNNGPRISSIRDTLGRVVSFRYDAAGNLQSIAVPGFGTGAEREVARFYYRTMTRAHDFADQQDYTQNIVVLDYLFMPGTKSGWHYLYSSYGQVYRVEKRAGMEFDPAGGGLTNTGEQVAVTEYDYNGSPLNPATNMLFQLPRYTRRTDDWSGNAAGPVVHQFAVSYADVENKSYSYITAPDNTVSEIQKRWYHATKHNHTNWKATWDEGLVLNAKIDRDGKTFAQVANGWLSTDGGPRLMSQTTTNDAGQQARVEYEYYDPPTPAANANYAGIFSNVHFMREYGFDGALKRRTEYEYKDDPAWTGRWLQKLPRSVKVYEGASTAPSAQTDYAYDEGEDQSYAALPDTYDTSTPSEHGNVTSVTVYTDAATPSAGATIVTRTGYDIFGNAVSSTDAVGSATAEPDDRVTTTEFSPQFKYAYPTAVTSVVPDPTGINASAEAHVSRTDYDFNTGLAVSATDVNNQVTTSSYVGADDPPHALNRLRRVTHPDGGEVNYEYGDAPGNFYIRTTTLRETSPSPRSLDAYQYFDPLGRPYRSFTYDGTASTPWIGAETKFDPFGRETEVSNPTRVANHGDAVTTPHWTVTTYDPLGRPLSVTTPDGAVLRTAYLGNKTLVTDPAGKSRRRETDALGRLVQVTEFTRTLADPTTVPDPDANDYLTSYEYDARDNLVKVRQGEVVGQGCPSPCQERVFAYDSLSRRKSVRNPESGTTTYKYDDNGNLKEKVDARGVSTTYEYDALNRPVRRAYGMAGGLPAPEDFTATPPVEFFYDGKGIPDSVPVPAASKGALGRLTAVKSSVSETIYSGFDAKGRIIASAQITPAPGVDGLTAPRTYPMSYEYDLAGNLTSQTYPTGRKITNTYDDAGRAATVTGTRPNGAVDAYVHSVSYTPSGKTDSVKLGNGLWEHVRYNSRYQPTEIGLSTAADKSADRLKLGYEYGSLVGGVLDRTKNNGNIQSQTISVAASDAGPGLTLKQEYEYDPLNRLRAAQEGGGAVWRQTFDYDRFGNREVNAAGTTDAIEQPRLGISGVNNRATAAGYVYDDAGNLTDEPGHTYKYDGEGKISEHDGGASATNPAGGSYGYDGEGRRITKREGSALTLFVYNALGQLVAEYSHSIRQGGTSYVTADHLSNTRVVTDSVGQVVSRHDYLPFGEELHPHLSASGRERIASYNPGTVRHKYASKERDRETGLDLFGTRYYSSAHGRFTSPDAPFADQYQQNPQSWNLYAYARNNPVRVGDRNGEVTPWDVLDVVSLVISVYELYQEPSLENAAWVVADLVGAALPLVPVGSLRRGYEAADMASDIFDVGRAVSKTDEVGDAGRFMFKAADDTEDGFTTFYHGTTQDYAASIRNGGIDINAGRLDADFGKGFYMSTSREVAERRALKMSEGATGIVEFRVPNSELEKLSSFNFGSATDEFNAFVRFNKMGTPYPPDQLMRGGEAYDMVSGPMVRRISERKGVLTWPSSWVQTSIHTPRAANLFNTYMVR